MSVRNMGTNGCLAHKRKKHFTESRVNSGNAITLIFQQINGGHYNVHTYKPRIYNCLL